VDTELDQFLAMLRHAHSPDDDQALDVTVEDHIVTIWTGPDYSAAAFGFDAAPDFRSRDGN
jgi:hypothetical protein